MVIFLVFGCGADDKPPGTPGGDPDAADPADAASDLDAEAAVDAAEIIDAESGPDAVPLTVEAMLASACTGSSCTPSKIVSYWRNAWDDYAVKRTVRFHDLSATEHALDVTDEAGNPATLEFQAGVPVTITIVNPGDSTSTGKHNLTGPRFFRAVAWRRATSVLAEYRASHFDAVHVRRRAGADLTVVLQFVPMNPGSFDLYCQTGVPSGNQYEAIVAGSVTPNLTDPAGHAGKGARATATITTSFAQTISQPVAALASDPRRAASHAVWATGARDETYRADPVLFFEFTDEEYAFIPANLALTRDVGHVIRIENPAANLRAHAFASRPFYDSSVLMKAQDDDVEIETSTLTGAQALVNGWTELFILPTMAAAFTAYCEVGVQSMMDGTPNLATGHAGRGMVGSITVSP
jgi:hypothetical protein